MNVIQPAWLKPGEIVKYESPALPIINWEEFVSNLIKQTFEKGQSATTIPYTPKNEEEVRAIENDEKYKLITEYVLTHESDPKVSAYLLELERRTTGNGHDSILFGLDGKLVSNWKELYLKYRTDGKYGYYHLNPDTILKGNGSSYLDISLKQLPRNKISLVSDIVPQAADLALNLTNNIKQYNAEVNKKVPLVEAKRRESLLDDGYIESKVLQQLANEIRSLGAQNLTSDEDLNLKLRLTYEDKANEIETQRALLQALKYQQSLEAAKQDENFNKEEGVNARNVNTERLISKLNLIQNAKQKLAENNAAARSLFNNSSYKSLTDAAYINKLNAKAKRAAKIKSLSNRKLRGILKYAQDYLDDFTNSLAFNQMLSSYANGNITLDDEGLTLFSDTTILPGAKFTPEQLNYLKKKFLGDSAYTALWEKELKNVNKWVDLQKWMLNSYAQDLIDQDDAYVNNLLFEFEDPRHTAPVFYQETPFMKSGSKISKLDRLTEFAKIYLRELEDRRKHEDEYNRLVRQSLSRDLNAIDRETLLLLRSIFK